ncbi:MAG: MATE family efflux transporter [Clostridia bacterium]|nr:MATE family efflux transporter [Clostridia bacterium]
MRIHLFEHFTYKKLLKFTLPSIVMMIFTSIYGVVDGYFVSNYVGPTPFAALNYIYPFLMILGSFGFMFGTGGGALIAKTLGEKNEKKANSLFSMFIYISIAVGVVLMLLGELFLEDIVDLLGASEAMREHCLLYGRIFLVSLPALLLQFEFQGLFITAEKPRLGLWMTVAAGVTNMALDALFVAVFEWGLAGAAWATAISQMIGGYIPLIYFGLPNSSLLRLGRFSFDSKSLVKGITNGSSELMTNVSMSAVNMLYNYQLLRIAGENGVAAYCVLMYVNMIFLAAYIGYSVGTAPIIGYHYGAKNSDELKSLLKKSIRLVGVCSVGMLLLSLLLARPLSVIFVGYDAELLAITENAFRIFSFSFLFAGFAIFGSSFFTALNNGPVSAAISFLRTLVFQIAAVLLLPMLWGIDGIWWSISFAEIMAVAVTAVFVVANRRKYQYY